jgi:hypothetical protein
VSSLTEQQVLEIVRNNYESLILKLEDNLDQYDRYAERPYETSFFTTIVSRRQCILAFDVWQNLIFHVQKVRRIVNEARSNTDLLKFERANILKEIGGVVN